MFLHVCTLFSHLFYIFHILRRNTFFIFFTLFSHFLMFLIMLADSQPSIDLNIAILVLLLRPMLNSWLQKYLAPPQTFEIINGRRRGAKAPAKVVRHRYVREIEFGSRSGALQPLAVPWHPSYVHF
jgi:hypothetical protein